MNTEKMMKDAALAAACGDDNWARRSAAMRCRTCMWWVRKGEGGLGRCRRHAPVVGQGWPAVFAGDWCGDDKLDEVGDD